ncbi:bifunctional folylpolyglutamate synthase/dihydrofolate synthase [Rhodovulum sp. DZ06]|uniref:bifunctional folylpolyglutamate synthase/dihydrofolate synthase n=1 Tax=Rhodovulum sp. DZ06 TaxID=3425126 RepID=UPI003D34F328
MALTPSDIELTLEPVRRLLRALGDPHEAIPPAIHVAGTNGKGSTLAMIRAGLESRGEACHGYNSPHLVRLHENIRLRGRPIAEPALAGLLNECIAANDGAGISVFEATTVAAFLGFSRSEADWTLLEVGLGGEGDATNVLSAPALTAITPISFDHEMYLGPTLAEIATHKAGIMRRGVPCVVAEQQPEALDAIEAHAAKIGAPLHVAGRDWMCWFENGRIVFQDANGMLDLPAPSLGGAHQAQNAGTAVAALRLLGADEAACAAALTGARWPARMQPIAAADLPGLPADAEVWLDGGHNPAAGEALAAHMAVLNARRPAPLHLVCGMLETKDPEAFLRPFAGQATHVSGVTILGAAATQPGEAIAAAARRAGLPADPAPSLDAAFEAVSEAGGPAPRVLICGSLYLAGDVLRRIGWEG